MSQPTMENEQIMALTRELSRRQMGRIWQRVKQGEALDNADEARLGKAMKDHPEYYDYWEKAGECKSKAVVDEKGTNPFLHLVMEVALENQIESGEIPEVKQALSFLIESGMEKHEARHAVLNVMVEEMWHVLREKRVFNVESYRRKLKKLMKRH